MSYQVLRSSNNAAYATVGSPTTGTSFVDSVSPDTTYLYKVQSIDGSANMSPLSDMDFATTVIFDDDPIVVGSTIVRASHLTQLRAGVNAMEAAAGIVPQTSFTDPTVNNSLTIKAVHISQLRTALNAARSVLGVSQLLFAHPSLSVVSAIDFQELRDGVK